MAIIAVNTRLLLPGKLDGIGWFTYETLKRITKSHPEHRFIFLFDRKFSSEFVFSDNIIPVVIPPQARHPLLWKLWFEVSVPFVLKKYKANLFLSPDGYLSLKSKIPSVAVIHDLNFEHYPKDIPPAASNYYRKYFPKFAAHASRIATVSEFSKNDIVERYKISPDIIDVVYDGANEAYKPLDAEEINAVRKQYANGCPYFIFVGALQPRKNIANLFKAFDLFKKKKQTDVKLLIVGNKQFWTNDIEQAYAGMQHKADVIFTGRLSIEELTKVMAASLALTYVSYFEGFGIPIVEAMRCNVPVITSNVTSMPEISGDAALLVDPFSTESIAEAMLKIETDEKLRNTLIEKGKIQNQKFTWDKAADLLWQTIEKTLP